MNITIIGTGFVGVVSAAVYASLDHQVIGLDIDQDKINSLKQGHVPFYEPQLEELLLTQQKQGNLSFTTSYQQAVAEADLVIVAVGTPSKSSGEVDLKYIYSACRELGQYIKDGTIVAIKSTVPPGTFQQVQPMIAKNTDRQFYLAALPEFLKEGTAVDDTLHPDRIIIGINNQHVGQTLTKLYQPFSAPILVMSPESAQMVKYTANSYLATRITFINHIADLCEHNNANIEDVIAGIGQDQRIGDHYWYPGLGYGGSCFPKDVKEMAHYAQTVNEKQNLLITIDRLNQQRIPKLMSHYHDLVSGWQAKRVAVLGLSFKPNTNDTRQAPAKQIVPILLKQGAKVRGYDPKASYQPNHHQDQYQQVESLTQACQDADAIFVLIEWPEIIEYDLTKHKSNKKQFVFDTRNQLDRSRLEEAGFVYQGIGQ